MKKTLFFSNVIGDITSKDNSNIKFNTYMEEYLKDNIDTNSNLVFINAPGLGNEENYLSNVLICFKKIGIIFEDVLEIEKETKKEIVKDFINKKEKIVYFLMGGNPYTQRDIIYDNELSNIIKEYDGLVIGFCAGAINLSQYSIITTDDDFKEKDSYEGIGREEVTIEPHYNSDIDIKRNKEIEYFAEKYNTTIYALPDESIIYFEKGKMYHKGEVKEF